MSEQATAGSVAAQTQTGSPPVELQQQQEAMQFKGNTESDLSLVEILKSIIA
jgi:anti-sigma28 factor (negative regulator of flagellin synthesis)